MSRHAVLSLQAQEKSRTKKRLFQLSQSGTSQPLCVYNANQKLRANPALLRKDPWVAEWNL